MMLNNAHGGLDSFKEMVNFAIFPSAGFALFGLFAFLCGRVDTFGAPALPLTLP